MSLRIFTLGAFRVYRGDLLIPDAAWKLQKNKALLKILFTYRQRALARDQLLEWLWPNLDPESANRNLRVAISHLRGALEPGMRRGVSSQYILTTDIGYAWNPRADYWLDVDEFQNLAHSAALAATDVPGMEALSHLKQAVHLYQGDYLEEDRYADWATAERERLNELYLALLSHLAEAYTKQRRYPEAASFYRQILAIDRCCESAWRQLMLCRYYAGDQAAARRVYEECRQALRAELDIDPMPETTDLYEKIVRHVLLAPTTAIPHNLPHYLTSFIGRTDELAELSRLASEPNCRLAALVGLGGMGKTRLAVEAAMQNLEHFPQGVYFVPLEIVDSNAGFISALVNALRLSFSQRDDPRTHLLDYLREKRLLLILDGFEGMPDETGLLVDILQSAPGVHILVTSRQRLNLQSACTLDVGGLAFSGGDVQADDAVQLFIERASRMCKDFLRGVEREKALILRICQFVDGMPLGIELAASWVSQLSCQEIADAIELDLDFLATTMQDVPEQHRGLRAVFDRSWSFLTPDECRAFSHLAVFRGGFRREAGVSVCGVHPAILSSLAAKSLLRTQPSGRYGMHDLVRQYAAEKLGGEKLAGEKLAGEKLATEKLAETPDEYHVVHNQHCVYFAAFVRQHANSLKGEQGPDALDELRSEIDNIWSAWRWAYEHGMEKEVDQCLEGLYSFCRMQGSFLEAQEAFDRAAMRWKEQNGSLSILGRLLARQGYFCERLGRYDAARVLIQAGLEIATRLGAEAERSFCLNCLGNLAYQEGKYTQAKQLYQEGQRSAQVCGARPELVRSLYGLGLVVESQGEYGEAKQIFQESLALAKDMNDVQAVAHSSGYLGLIACHLGEFTEAKTWCRSSLAALRMAGDRLATALILDYLGHAMLATGEAAAAGQLYQDSLVIRREIGNRWGIAASLDNLGRAASALGEFEAALHWHQASLAISTEMKDRGGTARTLTELAWSAYLRGAYPETKVLALQALEITRELGHRPGIARNLGCLAATASLSGETQEACVYLRQALEMATQKYASPLVLEILMDASIVLVQGGQEALAVELTAYVLRHPAAVQETHLQAQQLLSRLEAELPDDDFKTACERGNSLSFDAAWKIAQD